MFTIIAPSKHFFLRDFYIEQLSIKFLDLLEIEILITHNQWAR